MKTIFLSLVALLTAQIVNAQDNDLVEKAQAGDAVAQFELGNYYYFTEKNYLKAANWYFESASQENADAQFFLGVIYETEVGDYYQAVRWYRLAAEQGHSKAQCNLGFCYSDGACSIDENGLFHPDFKNLEYAIYWWQKAAEQGETRAKIVLSGLQNAILYGTSMQ